MPFWHCKVNLQQYVRLQNVCLENIEVNLIMDNFGKDTSICILIVFYTKTIPGQDRFQTKYVETRQQRGKCRRQRWHVSLSAAGGLGSLLKEKVSYIDFTYQSKYHQIMVCFSKCLLFVLLLKWRGDSLFKENVMTRCPYFQKPGKSHRYLDRGLQTKQF